MNTNLLVLSFTILTNPPVDSPVYQSTNGWVQDSRHTVVQRYEIGYKRRNGWAQRGRNVVVFPVEQVLTNWFTRKLVEVRPDKSAEQRRVVLEAELDRANAERDRLQRLVDKYAEAETARTNQGTKP